MFLYVKKMSNTRLKKLIIRTIDTNAIVIASYVCWDLDVNELWIESGKGKDMRWLPRHHILKKLEEDICRAIIF